MNRILISLGGLSGVSSLLLIDSAIKGAVLLLFASGFVYFLRRDSAATRHQVWLVAIVAMLIVPLLSALLPQWRVLPKWVNIADIREEIQSVDLQHLWSGVPEFDVSPPQLANGSNGDASESISSESPVQVAPTPAVASSRPATVVESTGEPEQTIGNWKAAIVAVWFAGFSVLIVRLIAARVLLFRTECAANVLSDGNPTRERETEHNLNTSFAVACRTLNIQKPVTLLVHPGETIPVVWGVLRPRLMLPVSAKDWSDEQLQSVFLHELAHIKRRDLLGQLSAQLACALHWFNPLVWFANWQLHVERERACDDLVLASGVRASVYAEHLLSVTTKLTTSPWTQACGLAMARSSSLHGRLSAVLSENENRRSVTTTLLVASLVLSVGIAIPLAMLRATDEPVAAISVAAAQDPEKDEIAKRSVNSPKSANTLPPNFEALLDWGEPVDGLRGAVWIQTVVQKPELANRPKIFLVLQNVSDKAIRFCDTQMIKNEDVRVQEDKRSLYLRDADIGILSGSSSSGGTDTDVELQPREVVMVDMMYGEMPNDDGLTISAALIDVIIHDPSLSSSASLNLVTAPLGAWSGKLTAPATRGAVSAMGPLPKDFEAQELFRYCLDNARLNGDIPAGMIDLLHKKVLYFIELNTGDQSGDPYAKRMQPIVARFENSGDWSQADAATLFDDISAVTTIPLNTTLDGIREHSLQRGQLLPASLQNANWGEALPGGLRMAWKLEPAADQYHLGSSLKSRVVIHNSGSEPVAFVTRSFQQPAHSASNVAGQMVQLESTYWTTRGRPEPYRLHPGEYCEVYAPGIGVGTLIGDDWANIRPGTWILASEGDEVVFQSGDVWLTGDHNQQVDPDWWLKFVTERLHREAPLPASHDERKLILFRVVQDLFGTAPRTTEADSFYTDQSFEALDNLALLLSRRSWMTPVTGAIKSAPTEFNVLAEDPDAATRPRVVTSPGRYNVGDELRLVVTQRRNGNRIVNEADLTWYPKGKDDVPTAIAIPDGYNTWAAGWLPGTRIVWVLTKDSLRSYDTSNPESIQVRQFNGEQQSSASLPEGLRARLTATIAIGETPQPTLGPAATSIPDVKID